MYSPSLTITPIYRASRLSIPPEKKYNQDSPNSDSRSLSPHHRSQNFCHEKTLQIVIQGHYHLIIGLKISATKRILYI